MQFASPNVIALPGVAWKRTRAAVPGSTLWLALITFLLVYTIAKSTDAASWVVMGGDVGPPVALAGAVLMGVLAVTPIPWWVSVAIGMLAGPVVAGVNSAPAFQALHGSDPVGWALVQTWTERIQDGSAFGDNAFVLFVITWLMWVTGAWLAWCVLRWRQPLIGLIPGAAAFSTNVLNYPDNQNGYTLGFLILTFALLLWTNYTSSISSAVRARVKLTGDAKWDFWESGLVATAALIVLAIMLPPISTIDRTATTESSLFSGWAALQQQLNHQSSSSGTGVGSSGTTGFSTQASLGGELKKSTTIVFTYSVAGQFVGPKYFRGVDLTQTVNGSWDYTNQPDVSQQIGKGATPDYLEAYQKPTYATFSVTMVVPPGGNTDVLFYPGQFWKVDRDTIGREAYGPNPVTASSPLVTIDRLSTKTPPTSKGNYNITAVYPNATEVDLKNAGTDYPQWLVPYMSLPPTGYRKPEVLQMELQLAQSLAQGKSNVFDIATAIQDYLRSSVFTYTLKPGNPPSPDIDRIDWFLNTGHKGYCDYFAIAMGDMLRLLNIPTRLVNGYGPGILNSQQNRNIVVGADAHTWVEVYFPGFGWIPFEPTPDSNYSPIARGFNGTGSVCVSDNQCDNPPPSLGATTSPTPRNIAGRGGNQDAGGGGFVGPGGVRFTLPDAGTLTRIAGILLALLLVAAAVAARYLRPRTVMGVWQRTLVLARLAGAARQPGETPLELGRRLARIFPEAAGPIKALAGGFVVAAYAPAEAAQGTRAGVMDAWTQLRPMMLKRVATRLRPHRT